VSDTTSKRRKRPAASRPAGKHRPSSSTAQPATSARATPRPRRKNLILDQSRIDRARDLLGAATETETITRALDELIDRAALRDEALAALVPVLGRSEIVNYFDDPAALDWSGFEIAATKPPRQRPKTRKRA
jgi:hypothetical protein